MRAISPDRFKSGVLDLADAGFAILTLLAANLRSLITWTMFPATTGPSAIAWVETVLWCLAFILLVYLLQRRRAFKDYLAEWAHQPFIVGFVLFSLASVLWSDSWTVTLHRALSLVFATVAAAYFGWRYSIVGFLRLLFWFCAFAILASLLLAVFAPIFGTDLNPPYNGAWRGVFWHKNHLGNLLPLFSMIFLLCALTWKKMPSRLEPGLSVLFYILSLFMTLKASSASGYISLAVLHVALIGIMLWLKFADRLKPIHYLLALAAVTFAVVAGFLNLDLILGLFNRNSSLTGRVPLWNYLLGEVLPLHPWGGVGFGALWSEGAFRVHMRDVLQWGYPVMIADNGFLDILLNLGFVGLGLFLIVYLQAWTISVRVAILRRDLTHFLFPLFMLFSLLANLTYSLFLETELLIWLLLITFLFIASRDGMQLDRAK